jgi:hypothetical protein
VSAGRGNPLAVSTGTDFLHLSRAFLFLCTLVMAEQSEHIGVGIERPVLGGEIDSSISIFWNSLQSPPMIHIGWN